MTDVLAPEALAFVERLQRELGRERRDLLAARAERQRRLDAGERPDFLAETRDVLLLSSKNDLFDLLLNPPKAAPKENGKEKN